MKNTKIGLLSSILLIIGLVNGLSAQILYVHDTSQSIASFTLSTVSKITFTNNLMILKLKSNNYQSWTLTTVDYFNFSRQTLGLKEESVSGSKSFKIYPNPGNGNISVGYFLSHLGRVNIDILALDGRLLDHSENNGSIIGNNTVQLSETGLLPGTYFCRIQTAEFTSTQKFIINK